MRQTLGTWVRSGVREWLRGKVLHVWRCFFTSVTDWKSTLNVHVDGGGHLHWFHQKTILCNFSLLHRKRMC